MELEPLRLLASYLKLALRSELIQQGHVASSQLINSIDVVVREVVGQFHIEGRAVYYAKHVEEGRLPGKRGIPIDDLIAWIRRGRKRIYGMSERSQAFMIQASIKNKGIEPSYFIRDTLEKAQNEIEDYIYEACSRLVDIRIDQMFNEIS